jgi:hypothetical protein
MNLELHHGDYFRLGGTALLKRKTKKAEAMAVSVGLTEKNCYLKHLYELT